MGADRQDGTARAAHISGDVSLSSQGVDLLGQGRFPSLLHPVTSIETAGSGQYQVSVHLWDEGGFAECSGPVVGLGRPFFAQGGSLFGGIPSEHCGLQGGG